MDADANRDPQPHRNSDLDRYRDLDSDVDRNLDGDPNGNANGDPHSMRHLFDYLRGKQSRRHKLPHLVASLRQELDAASLDEDDYLLLMTGSFRDVQAAREFLYSSGSRNAIEALPKLPKPKRMTFKQRLLRWLQELEGSQPTDPMLQQRREWLRQEKKTERGW